MLLAHPLDHVLTRFLSPPPHWSTYLFECISCYPFVTTLYDLRCSWNMYLPLEEVQNRIQFSCTNNAHGIQEYVAGYESEMTSNTERRQCTSSCVYDAEGDEGYAQSGNTMAPRGGKGATRARVLPNQAAVYFR